MDEKELEALRKQIKPFNIEQPFVFISYSKMDKARVYPLVLELQKNGCNLWIDKELENSVGESWQQALKIMASRGCKAIVFMMSEHSFVSAPVLAELAWSQKSSKVKRHNDNEPLKLLPVNVDEKWRIKDGTPLEDWVKRHVNQNDEDLTSADMDSLKCLKGEGLDDKYFEGASKLEAAGEIADAIYDEVMKPLGGNRLTLVEYTDVDAIVSNILNKTGQTLAAAPDTANSPSVSPAPNNQPAQTQPLQTTTQPAQTSSEPTKSEESIEENSSQKSARKASSTGDITYTLYGEEYTDNQANMLLRVFEQVLNRHPEAVDEIFKDAEKPAMRCASRTNYELPENKTPDIPSRFKTGAFFDINGGIFVGTGLNYPEKLRNIAKLLTICGEDYSILCSDAIELPTLVKTK